MSSTSGGKCITSLAARKWLKFDLYILKMFPSFVLSLTTKESDGVTYVYSSTEQIFLFKCNSKVDKIITTTLKGKINSYTGCHISRKLIFVIKLLTHFLSSYMNHRRPLLNILAYSVSFLFKCEPTLCFKTPKAMGQFV